MCRLFFYPKNELTTYAILAYMRSDKGKAFILRRSGKSYREIADELGVAKSTLSTWFKGVDFSEAIRSELTKKAAKRSGRQLQELNRVRGIALSVQYEQAEKEALKEMKLYRNLPLFTTALAVYWGEGDKRSRNQVRVTNTDSAMLKVFIAFLQEVCGVDKSKIRLALFIYNDLDETKCKRFWKRQLGSYDFHKTQVLPGKHKTKRLPHGVCTIVVSNTYLKKKILLWIDQLPEMVLNTVPKK